MAKPQDARIVPPSTKPASGSKTQRAKLGAVVPPFFPHPNVFIPQTMDVWTGSGAVPPPAGAPRLAAVNIGITGVWAEGHRTKSATSDAYTHVILADPSTAILDPYKGNSQTLLQAGDTLAIPAGQTSNWWLVVFSYVTNLAGVGRRRVILADRFGTPGNWAVLV